MDSGAEVACISKKEDSDTIEGMRRVHGSLLFLSSENNKLGILDSVRP